MACNKITFFVHFYMYFYRLTIFCPYSLTQFIKAKTSLTTSASVFNNSNNKSILIKIYLFVFKKLKSTVSTSSINNLYLKNHNFCCKNLYLFILFISVLDTKNFTLVGGVTNLDSTSFIKILILVQLNISF